MSRIHAHRILNRWREGFDYSDAIIYCALVATGDIREGS
jgi:hypothetical protein